MELFWMIIFWTLACGVGLELLIGPFNKNQHYFINSLLLMITLIFLYGCYKILVLLISGA